VKVPLIGPIRIVAPPFGIVEIPRRGPGLLTMPPEVMDWWWRLSHTPALTKGVVASLIAELEHTTQRRIYQALWAGRREEAEYWQNALAFQLYLLQSRLHGPPRSRPGRRRSILGMSYDQWFERMREARDRCLVRGETPTQAQLMAMLGIAGEDRRVREWLKKLGLSWEDFLNLR
jgi:hypothetical protein